MPFPFDVLSWLIRGRVKTTPPSAADGETVELQCTPAGRLKVDAQFTSAVTYSQYKPATGADKKGVIKASAGALRYVQVSNKSSSTGYWLLLLNKSTLPVDGDAVEVVFPLWIPAGETRAVDLPADLVFSSGIAWCASTSMGDVTLPVGDNLWVNALYT